MRKLGYLILGAYGFNVTYLFYILYYYVPKIDDETKIDDIE